VHTKSILLYIYGSYYFQLPEKQEKKFLMEARPQYEATGTVLELFTQVPEHRNSVMVRTLCHPEAEFNRYRYGTP
jgi:hypothetical protein